MRLLVVEDDDKVVRALQRGLAREGIGREELAELADLWRAR